MSFMKFLDKYKTPASAPATSTAVGAGATMANVGAERQLAEMEQLKAQEARKLGTAEEQFRAQELQGRMQQTAKMESLRQDSQASRQKYQQLTNGITSDLKMKMTDFSEAEKRDQLEAAAITMRLGDEKYAYSLADEGRRKRLDDSVKFDEALKESVFDDEIELFRSNIGFQKLMDSSDATFARQIADMDVSVALALAGAEAKAASRNAIVAGGTQAATSLGGYVAGRAAEKPETVTPRSTVAGVDYTNTNSNLV
jgi:hypothetical protein